MIEILVALLLALNPQKPALALQLSVNEAYVPKTVEVTPTPEVLATVTPEPTPEAVAEVEPPAPVSCVIHDASEVAPVGCEVVVLVLPEHSNYEPAPVQVPPPSDGTCIVYSSDACDPVTHCGCQP